MSEVRIQHVRLGSGYRPKNPTVCPKCGYISGDDWRQCRGSCPMEQSPHFKPRPSPAASTEEPGR